MTRWFTTGGRLLGSALLCAVLTGILIGAYGMAMAMPACPPMQICSRSEIDAP
ncbi:hypothetical protein [Rhizosaccharibacter radicis]|uniref:Uncharacterized protein n=1 Tax=Rhizosaccharibacter radicis TaxID=2782605 RepID=A0ABT1VW52_9PROT|nr:hypothetical protein [Acetobacteraceae bacterium KSS12]